jgi:hypothetical protein
MNRPGGKLDSALFAGCMAWHDGDISSRILVERRENGDHPQRVGSRQDSLFAAPVHPKSEWTESSSGYEVMYNLAEAKLEIASIVRAVRFRPGRLFRLNETLGNGCKTCSSAEAARRISRCCSVRVTAI